MSENVSQNMLFLRESDAGIEAVPDQDWKMIVLYFNKQQILSCLPKDVDLSLQSLYGFDKEKFMIMQTVAYLFGLPPEYENLREKQDDIVTRQILEPPTIDDQIEHFSSVSEVQDALALKNYRNNKLRHMAFLTVLKHRRDLFAGKLDAPMATNSERAVYLGQLWIPITPQDIDNTISRLESKLHRASQEERPSSEPKSGTCFIATAACGSQEARDVIRLRDFRDIILKGTYLGRAVVMVYERLSPPLAMIIERSKSARLLVHFLLVRPLGWIAEFFLLTHSSIDHLRVNKGLTMRSSGRRFRRR